MDAKRSRTKWDKVQLEVFGWSWLGTWLIAIWWEQYRWPLFWTGMLFLLIGMSIASRTTPPSEKEK